VKLNKEDLELLGGRNFAHFATISADGSPRATVLWVDTDGTDVILNRNTVRSQIEDLKRDPRVSVSLHDQAQPYRALTVRGRVVEITEVGAREHIDKLAMKYRGRPFQERPNETRLIVRVRPERVHRYGY
jgi:PPOX class probable F420-dependent enzyme